MSETDEPASPPPPASPPLTEPQIAWLVEQYKKQIARYEKAGYLVAERLRRELRQAGVKHMISTRPKHPDDLAGKLRKKAKEKPEVYRWDALKEDLGAVVTDLGGCRVVVYSSADEEIVGGMVRRLFAQPARADATVDRRMSVDRRYWATHALVHPYGPQESVEFAVEGAVCELQIVTAAAHLFNEIEHDITYKDRDAGLSPTDDERQYIVELQGVARVADRLVTELLALRARRREEQAHVIEDAEDLRYTLTQHAKRNFDGTEMGRLLGLLEQSLDRVTPSALRDLGEVDELVAKGRARLGDTAADHGEAVLYTVGLLENLGPEIGAAVKTWRGPRTSMRRAIELALSRMSEQASESE